MRVILPEVIRSLNRMKIINWSLFTVSLCLVLTLGFCFYQNYTPALLAFLIFIPHYIKAGLTYLEKINISGFKGFRCNLALFDITLFISIFAYCGTQKWEPWDAIILAAYSTLLMCLLGIITVFWKVNKSENSKDSFQ